ncbi:hypothetical protein [Cryobacterium sp. PAMC25264]|uniref:hypothetical protein n=1 Tax=Cryobacterium sp. PAMC25264 TaxID=2861288 RepID=UPI001C625B1A|nr:hypothetical protein [Cryobacterium sp. PAMC25264]QYF72700.1 hypothetical protein KY500_12925 [Cryobacterium sp. PAMC25264]
MSRAGKDVALIVGGVPRVDLLPPEVHRERHARVVRRRMGWGVISVVAFMALGIGGSIAWAMQAQSQLASEQALTPKLLEEQSKYLEVRTVQSQVELVRAAQQVGASTEIDWKSYLDSVQAILPPSVSVETVTVDSASPLALYVQPTAPLQGARVATVTFTVKSAILPDVPTWLDSLADLRGVADVLPGSVARGEDGVFTVTLIMHVNDAALAQRFTGEEK